MSEYYLSAQSLTDPHPTRDEIAQATEKTIDELYEGEWIETISEMDAKELLKMIWSYSKNSYRGAESKIHDISIVMNASANAVCGEVSTKEWFKNITRKS